MLAFRFSTRVVSGAKGLFLVVDNLDHVEDCSGDDDIRPLDPVDEEPEWELSILFRIPTEEHVASSYLLSWV